jgi:hypothetical protein
MDYVPGLLVLCQDSAVGTLVGAQGDRERVKTRNKVEALKTDVYQNGCVQIT